MSGRRSKIVLGGMYVMSVFAYPCPEWRAGRSSPWICFGGRDFDVRIT